MCRGGKQALCLGLTLGLRDRFPAQELGSYSKVLGSHHSWSIGLFYPSTPSHNRFSEYWVNLWFGSGWVGLGFTQSTSYHFVGKMALSTDHLATLRSV